MPSVLLLVGGILFLSGHGLFAASFFQGVDGSLATIPSGPFWFVVYEFKVLGASRVFGAFSAPAGGLLDVFVLNETEREIFSVFGFGPSLLFLRGASGAFSANLPGAGTYYLAVGHGEGSKDSAQDVRVSYRVAGIQPDLLDVGVPFIAVGIAAVGIGLRLRHRGRAIAQ